MQTTGTVRHRRGRWALGTTALVLAGLAVAVLRTLPMLSALLALGAITALFVMLTIDPDLLGERWRRGQTGADPMRLAVIRASFLVLVVVALVDIGRFHWSSSMPRGLQWTALGGLAASFALITWAMSANRFFVPVIRLQTERGHQVVSRGPYAHLRHPGYTGMALAAPAAALALGSWLALLPGLLLTGLFIARAVHEDRFLMSQLEGYTDYASRVRWRLLPGVW